MDGMRHGIPEFFSCRPECPSLPWDPGYKLHGRTWGLIKNEEVIFTGSDNQLFPKNMISVFHGSEVAR